MLLSYLPPLSRPQALAQRGQTVIISSVAGLNRSHAPSPSAPAILFFLKDSSSATRWPPAFVVTQPVSDSVGNIYEESSPFSKKKAPPPSVEPSHPCCSSGSIDTSLSAKEVDLFSPMHSFFAPSLCFCLPPTLGCLFPCRYSGRIFPFEPTFRNPSIAFFSEACLFFFSEATRIVPQKLLH